MKFVIYGNQEDPQGNPIGYHRTTQGSYWNAGSKRYKAWKDYVAACYERSMPSQRRSTASINQKPIASKEKHYLRTMIYFANNARPDPDNVQKGIADALFQNDKNVAGSYDFAFDKERPRVEVQITPASQP